MEQNTDVKLIALEEFIPVENVNAMLDVAQSLLSMLPQQRAEVADNLKRSMVWMRKYIAPTSEFWDWETFQQPIDQHTDLRVSFIGLGWIVALTREFSDRSPGSIVHVERDLAVMLDRITSGIPLEAILRLRASRWTSGNLKHLTIALKSRGIQVSSHTRTQKLRFGASFDICLNDQERLTASGISNQLDVEVRKVLLEIKQWANAGNHFQGADWCAYKRRRLTTVVRQVAGDSDFSPSQADFDFTNEPSGNYERERAEEYDILSAASTGSKRTICSVVFPAYQYHRGILNPRMVVRTREPWNSQIVDAVSRYYSYLWVNHYTRLWRYLAFEDQFAYTSDVRRIHSLSDSSYYAYSERIRTVSDLRASIELANRIDRGEISAYAPPHGKFLIEPGRSGSTCVITWLQKMLIPSTVTRLTRDPLNEAPAILDHAAQELGRTYTNFAESASLRMQRSLQVLQILFVVAAITQVLILIPIPEILEAYIRSSFGHGKWFKPISHWRHHLAWLHGADLTLYTMRLLIIITLTLLTLAVIRWQKVTSLLRRLFE